MTVQENNAVLVPLMDVDKDNNSHNDNDNLRIVCLLPSATDICIALGLASFIVGVTHECNVDAVLKAAREKEEASGGDDATKDNNNNHNKIRILTSDGLGTITSQQDIHDAVSAQWKKANATKTTTTVACSLPTPPTTALEKSKSQEKQQGELPPSLYPILEDELYQAQPTIVITQDLCSVCAPSTLQVEQIIMKTKLCEKEEIQVLSLQPTTIGQVSDSFVSVADICNIRERGQTLQTTFLNQLECLKEAITTARQLETQSNNTIPQPTLLLLEWLAPPFDGGHWILQMMDYACVKPAIEKNKTKPKSEEITWDTIESSNPDCVLVACCGFDLQRNMVDAIKAQEKLTKFLFKATSNGNIFACNGDQYFARPGPSLLMGTIIMALCAYQHEPDVIRAIHNLPFVPESVPGYEKVVFPNTTNTDTRSNSSSIPDIEDTLLQETSSENNNNDDDDFVTLHDTACANGEMTYKDPATGYSVFTELAHQKRGKCCGSGCRHCPYSHANVVDKVNRIQQPAFLHVSTDESLFQHWKHDKTKVLFFSGGKDSFLAIRALVKQYFKDDQTSSNSSLFGLVLLTTFDSASRMIAHQNVHIENVVRQCKHLNISLLGVPMHRASKEPYVNKIRKALDVIKKDISTNNSSGGDISALVFGDLHLDHIKSWRDEQLGTLGYDLEYPLWKANYNDLMMDLEASSVPCALSAVTVDSSNGISVGDMFNREFSNTVTRKGIDGFGEQGEFHSLAQVWEVSRQKALGIPDSSS